MASERVGNFVDLALPSGTQLHVPSSGVEMLLIGFLQDPSRGVDQNVWFNFDRLLFDTGSARLQPQSREQLRNVADVLKAYPSATLKIGGYTDDQGDAAANQALSTARATVVKNELVGLGIAPDRLVAEGYGAANPVADNATEQGRAQNRRIALQVTRK
jgi:outer membrane protein OmpA-like peptidoglycan-associated protein